jgi:Zn-dependent peptidase ImmA (M78 family)
MIPKKFTVGPKTYKVKVVEQETIDGNSVYGSIDTREGLIQIATHLESLEVPEKEQYLTFNHELIHAVLHAMGETELYNNERFVEGFSQLLSQYELTRKY